jgi:hypothetical protein
VAYADAVHVWEQFGGPHATYPIAAAEPVPGARRELAIVAGSSIPGTRDIWTLLEDSFYMGSGRYLRRLAVTEAGAWWSTTAIQLAYTDYLDVSRPLWTYSDAEMQHPIFFPVVIDVLSRDSGTVRVHSVGPFKNFGRYGMDYSALADVDERGASALVASLAPGFAKFRSDGQGVLLRHLRRPLRLESYSLDGVSGGTIRLTPHRVLGQVQDTWLQFDLCGTHLWLADGYGQITCSDIS